MSKKMLLAAAVLALASCAAEKEAPFFRYCPNVQLVPEFSRMTQMAGKQEEAKIELIGYEGYCRTDLRNQTKAVVPPYGGFKRIRAFQLLYRYRRQQGCPDRQGKPPGQRQGAECRRKSDVSGRLCGNEDSRQRTGVRHQNGTGFEQCAVPL